MRRMLCLALAAVAVALAIPVHLLAQDEQKLGNIVGTVTDVNGDPVPDATVEFKSSDGVERRAIVTPDNGYFEFHGVKPGIRYEVGVSAVGFAGWSSPTITIGPGEFKIVTGIQLRIHTELTEVQVHYDPVEVATEQLKVEESQRVFGIIPNFYVTYDKDAAPLTAKMKFQLALKVSVDPVTIAGVAFYSGIQQAGDTPNYGQGAKGYGERFGANAATGFSDIMIGGAILPSVLHQDPRYFYQGTGTTSSRIRHAVFSPFVARGDNGSWQPNYSSLGGDLAAAAISNTYYPRSDRGVGLVFGNFAIGTAERIGASLAQEFIIGKYTRRGGHVE